jgi:hypothetical protein
MRDGTNIEGRVPNNSLLIGSSMSFQQGMKRISVGVQVSAAPQKVPSSDTNG